MTKETIIDVSKQYRDLQVQYEKVVEQNRQLQQELRDKTAECEELKEQLEKNRKLTLEYISSGEKYLKALDEIEQYCNKYGQNSIGFRKNILDIIKRTGGQRVKAERTRLMPARPRQKTKEGEE